MNDQQLSLKYAEELIALAELTTNYKYLQSGYIQKGDKFKKTGDTEKALSFYFKSVEAAKKANFIEGEGTGYMLIADVYAIMDNFSNADRYYKKAINILRKSNDSIRLASALLNAGDTFFNNKKYDEALEYFEESGQIFKDVNYLIGTVYNLGNVGMVYAEQGKDNLAEKNINEAIAILEEMGDYYPISVYLTYMADIYVRKDNLNAAFTYAQRSLDLAKKYGLKKEIGDTNLKLSELYEIKGNDSESLKYYKEHIKYRDTVKNIESVEKIADLRTNYEVSQKQTEVDLLSQQKKNQRIVVIATVIAAFLIGILAFGLFRRNKFIQKTKQIIENEKKRSENLLLNILPEETAKELIDKGRVQAKKIESVTVLFTDFKGFTQYSENLTPEELVESVDFYFSKFDEIMDKYGLEKIKTIGDAYMSAGGLPFPTEDHALKMILAAKEIIEFVATSKRNNDNKTIPFEIRIGINTGPVVAGVVGIKKFAYDIWGDTVNIASRMESNSEIGKINISQNTYKLVKDHFNCEYRGKIEAKNRGMLKMYFVNEQLVTSNN